MTSAGATELPELGRRPLVVVDQFVQLELIDLAGVEPCKAVAHVLEQRPQLTPLIGAMNSREARRPALSTERRSVSPVPTMTERYIGGRISHSRQDTPICDGEPAVSDAWVGEYRARYSDACGRLRHMATVNAAPHRRNHGSQK